MARLYADLHCHSTMFSFNRMRNTSDEQDPSKFQPWHVMPSNLDDMEQGKRGATYAQASPDKLHYARARLICTSFTPIEKGFFQGHHGLEEQQPFAKEVFKVITGQTLLRSSLALLRGEPFEAAAQWTGLLKNRGPLRKLVQTIAMRYSPDHIGFLMSERYDYWEEFIKEYEFLASVDGQLKTATLELPASHQRGQAKVPVQGRLSIIKTSEQLAQIIDDEDNRDVAMLLTIEGGHVFSIDPQQRALPKEKILERVRYLKSMAHPIFFITIAHHFDNGFCGHAHSIPDAAKLVMDQSYRLHEGFERQDDLGLSVARALLDLDEQLQPQGHRRILIDSKHMSAQARREYYNEIIEPYQAQWSTWDEAKQQRYPQIPVFFSHGAYSGVPSLEAQIRDAHLEDDRWHNGPFYAWNINLSDEDVRMVHKTDGLIGLVFEQRVAGVKPFESIPAEKLSQILIRHILSMVDVVMLDSRIEQADKLKIWDCICLGTDYDGFIDPISRYPTVLDLDLFAQDLRQALEQVKHTRMIEQIGLDELVENICWRNIYRFTLKHLPAAS